MSHSKESSHPRRHIRPGDLVQLTPIVVGGLQDDRILLVVDGRPLVSDQSPHIDNGQLEVELPDGRRRWLPAGWFKLHQEG